MALSEPSFDYDPFHAYDHDREAKETSFASLLGVAARAIKLPAQQIWTPSQCTSEGAALMTQNSFVYAGCWFILETSAPRDCYRSLYHRSCSNGRSHNKIPGSDFDAVIGEWNDWSKTSYSCKYRTINWTSFGYWLSYFSVISRCVLAMFWFGVQCVTGGQCVYQCLKAIWPSIARVPNGESFFVSLYRLPENTAVLAPVTGLSMMTWAFVKTGGGPIFEQKATISGSALSWGASYPLTLCALGINIYSAGNVIYGEILWNPLTLIDHWDNRAAAFFASFVFCLATIGTNVSANSISAANDFTALLPKAGRLWLNIKRGQILCALIGGWVVCPWEILGNIDIPALYDPKGRYRYVGGVVRHLHWVVDPNSKPVIRTGVRCWPFACQFLLIFQFSLAGVTYFITSTLFPPRETMVDELITGDDQTSQSNDLENVTDEKHSDVKVKVTTQAA
ncbi:cytosine-purine permease [Rhizoctonia solani AG-1 IA]|uniref:Cytosine-purine permease n=1 Tax=Thanatephorus cucumeris (strain AG1-IA) TaxID=983506 RepID=L8X747_THACA|nr:cytosine-purine permease [Rhizoctonia solani AG-1 IA]